MAFSQVEIEKRISDSYELPNNVLQAVPNPMVTVRTSTYQHGSYIEECIQGVLMQKTDFPFEFIIGEDYSSDGTREIVFEYAKKYPDIIRVITADYNVGSKANGRRCINAARGKYMAICEGDDYWTDPLKLQKQVDFLEKNPKFGLIYTKAKVFKDKKQEFQKKVIGTPIPREGIFFDNPIPTGTALLRRDLLMDYLVEMQSHLNKWKMGDYPLWIWFDLNSKIHFLPEITGVYRVRRGSASHFHDGNKRMAFMESSFLMSDYFARKYLQEGTYDKFIEGQYLKLLKGSLLNRSNKYTYYLSKLKRSKSKGIKTRFYLLLLYNFRMKFLFNFYFSLR